MAEFPASAVVTAMLFHSVTAFCADAMPGRTNVVRAIAVNNLGFMIDSPGLFQAVCLLIRPEVSRASELTLSCSVTHVFCVSRRCPIPLYYVLIASRPVRSGRYPLQAVTGLLPPGSPR